MILLRVIVNLVQFIIQVVSRVLIAPFTNFSDYVTEPILSRVKTSGVSYVTMGLKNSSHFAYYINWLTCSDV